MFSHGALSIRAIEESDLEFLKNQRNDPETWRYLSDISMLTSHGQREWLARTEKDPSKKYFILENERGHSVGFVRCDEIDQLNQSIRVGADIHPDFRGIGLGTVTYELLLQYCFNYLNMNRVWLLVLASNERAHHLYTKVGFKEEGRMRQAIYRDGAFDDHIMMSILREEWRK